MIQSQSTSHCCAILNHFCNKRHLKSGVIFTECVAAQITTDQLLHTTVWVDSHTHTHTERESSHMQHTHVHMIKWTWESGCKTHRRLISSSTYHREVVCVYVSACILTHPHTQHIQSTAGILRPCTSHKTTREQLLKMTWNKTQSLVMGEGRRGKGGRGMYEKKSNGTMAARSGNTQNSTKKKRKNRQQRWPRNDT